MAVSRLFVTTASTETLNGTISGVTFCLEGAKQLLHPKSYRLAKQTSLHNSVTQPKYTIDRSSQYKNPIHYKPPRFQNNTIHYKPPITNSKITQFHHKPPEGNPSLYKEIPYYRRKSIVVHHIKKSLTIGFQIKPPLH